MSNRFVGTIIYLFGAGLASIYLGYIFGVIGTFFMISLAIMGYGAMIIMSKDGW